MSIERILDEGHLSIKDKQAKKLELTIKALRDSVRLYLSRRTKIEDLEILIASQVMADLVDAVGQYHELLAEIKQIKSDLGKE